MLSEFGETERFLVRIVVGFVIAGWVAGAIDWLIEKWRKRDWRALP